MGRAVIDRFNASTGYQPAFAGAMDDGTGQAFPMIINLATAEAGQWLGGKFDHRGQQWVSATSGPAAANVALEG